jgi:predicted chitinase
MVTRHKKKALKTAKPREDNSFRQEVSLTCACNRDITLAELGRTYTARSREKLEIFLPHLNSMFKKYEINSCIRKTHFLAQVGHETGQLSLLAEVLKKGVKEADVYDGYKGRGLIQITYKAGYVAYGEYVNEDFTGDKKTGLEEIKWATDSAGWYWSIKTVPSLNGYADKNDLIYITQSINGAFNGYSDRLMLLGRAAGALLVDGCPNLPTCPNIQEFHLDRSSANDIAASAFAWGLWHDPESNKQGTPKIQKESLIGYSRFLELKKNQKRGRFGFKTAKSMISHAEDRIMEIGDNNE